MGTPARRLRLLAVILALVALGTCTLRVSPVGGGFLPSLSRHAPVPSAAAPIDLSGGADNEIVVLPRRPPSCFGSIVVLDADDYPLAGAVVTWFDVDMETVEPSLGFTATTDTNGITPPAMRPCGELWLNVESEGRVYGMRPANIVGSDDVVLRLPAYREGEVCVVDATDAPINASEVAVYASGGEVAEALAEAGCWSIAAAGWQVGVTVISAELGTVHAEVPLDGVPHIVRLTGLRDVEVHTECDPAGCPAPLSTGFGLCEGESSPFICSCQSAACFIVGPPQNNGMMEVLGEVPAGATSVHLDLRTPGAAVRGRWTGALPASATLDAGPSAASAAVGLGGSGRSWSFRVEENGSFALSDLPAGAYTLRVDSDSHECGSRSVVLVSGQEMEAGTISPNTGTLRGRIDADFPLDEATLTASVGTAHLKATGGLDVAGVPEQGTVRLTLVAPDRGQWTESFPTGAPADWIVSWLDGRNIDPVGADDTGP